MNRNAMPESPADGLSLVERLANAVLYEGYILYPYRASAAKNQQRFNFGGLYPPAYSQSQSGADACRMQTEVLVSGPQAKLEVRVRFLHLISQEAARTSEPHAAETSPVDESALDESALGESAPAFEIVPSVEVQGRVYYTWQEAVEREIIVSVASVRDLTYQDVNRSFSFPASSEVEPLRSESGALVARVTRRQQEIFGNVEVSAHRLAATADGAGLFRVRVAIENRTPLPASGAEVAGCGDSHVKQGVNRDEALPGSMASTHAILSLHGGQFVSLLDPPENLREEAAACHNEGVWPVLVGANGQRDTMLASPIILYDYPQIAPESPGDLCDGLEIDEILTLRILSLTDEEKREMRGVDARARAILERTERLPQEQWMKMHGVVRGVNPKGETAP